MSSANKNPLWVRSPWLDDISDETAEILSRSIYALAMACEDRCWQELRRYYQPRHDELHDPTF
jgi:hypothetical protein